MLAAAVRKISTTRRLLPMSSSFRCKDSCTLICGKAVGVPRLERDSSSGVKV